MYTLSHLERYRDTFMSRVSSTPCENGCLHWQGKPNKHGYGKFTVGHSGSALAHRIMYVLTTGESLERFDFICHSCDTPICVNPDHLFKSTPQGNMDDKVAKGRQTFPAKFAEAQIKQVFELGRTERSYDTIAAVTGVTRGVVNHVLNGRAWVRLRPQNYERFV